MLTRCHWPFRTQTSRHTRKRGAARCGFKASRKVTTNERQLCSCVFVWRMIRRLDSRTQCWSFEDRGSGSHNKRKMPGAIGSRWSFSRRHGPMNHSTCGMHRSAFHFLLRMAKATSCSWTTLVRKPRTKLCRPTRPWRTPRFTFFQATQQTSFSQSMPALVSVSSRRSEKSMKSGWRRTRISASGWTDRWRRGSNESWSLGGLEWHGRTCLKRMRSPLRRLGWKQGASWQQMGVKMHWSVRKALSNTHFAMRMEAAKGMTAKRQISKASMSFYQTWKCCTLTALTTVNHRDSQLQVWSAWKIMKNRVGSTWFEIQAKSSLLGAEKLQEEHELSFRTSRRTFPKTENDDESSIAAYKLLLTPHAGTEAPPAGTEGFSSKLFNQASSSLGRFRRMNPRWKAWNPSKATAPFLFPCRQGNER